MKSGFGCLLSCMPNGISTVGTVRRIQYIRYLYLYLYMHMYIIASWKTAGFRDDTTCVHCVASNDTVQKNL